MAFTISGFGAATKQTKDVTPTPEVKPTPARKSLVKVRFPGGGFDLTYFNDRFDLKLGDRVYVEGAKEGILGQITEVSYSFKIKPSDYMRVTTLVDTQVHGQFHLAGTHFVTFEKDALPPEKVKPWFFAPTETAEEEFIIGSDDSGFALEDLKDMNISQATAQRGHQYYLENRVVYLNLCRGKGFAIVEGTEPYRLEFTYEDGNIRDLYCDCPCVCTCKHAFAAMLQLRETLEHMKTHYHALYQNTDCFSAIDKATLFRFTMEGRQIGSFTL